MMYNKICNKLNNDQPEEIMTDEAKLERNIQRKKKLIRLSLKGIFRGRRN